MDAASEERFRETIAREIEVFEIRQQRVSQDICAVHVFSGPGTVLEPFSKGDEEWSAWCDHRRVFFGIWLVMQVTALRLRKDPREVTRSDIKSNGPYLIYNGVPDKHENEDLQSVASLPRFPIPESRMIVFGEVGEGESKRDIVHTGDQVESFPANALDGLDGSIALISNAPHFPRILRYIQHYQTIPSRFRVRCYPIPSDPEWAAQYARSEINAVCKYLEAGYLAEVKYPAYIG